MATDPKTMQKPAPPRTAEVVEVIDPRWLLKAAGAVVAVAVLCGYLCVCGLFWWGQWQLVLHPSPTVARTPAVDSLQFEPVRFGADSSGTPPLTGWYLPSESPRGLTALMLHSGDGNMADALPEAQLLHTAQLNVLLFDYRGFGASSGPHPSQHSMQEDSEAALAYLTSARHIPLVSVIVFGQGVGASLAARLCAEHREVQGLILNAADGDMADRVANDPRSRMVPARLLLHERFPLAGPLSTLPTPKLIIAYGGSVKPAFAKSAADPKLTVELNHADVSASLQALHRFLETYVGQPM